MPPLGILYLSAVLKRNGHYVDVVDLAGGARLPTIEADVIGIGSTTPQFPSAVSIMNELKISNPDALYVCGGPHASCDPKSVLDAGFDVCIMGEGERAFHEVVKMRENGVPLHRFMHRAPPIQNLDDLPFPDREAINVRVYKYLLDGERCTTMITSRGCQYNCAFCCKEPWGRKVRMHSADRVINEIKEIQELGFSAVMFFDDIFILNKKRLYKICDYLRSQSIIWRCFVRSDLINREMLKTMARSGCKEMGLGVESGSQQILDNIHKGTTVEKNRECISLAKEYGISTKAFIIVGLPGESWSTIEETERFLEDTEPSDVDFTVLSVFPGSDIYQNPSKYDLKFDTAGVWYKGRPGEYVSHVATSSLTPQEIVDARDRLEKKFKRW